MLHIFFLTSTLLYSSICKSLIDLPKFSRFHGGRCSFITPLQVISFFLSFGWTLCLRGNRYVHRDADEKNWFISLFPFLRLDWSKPLHVFYSRPFSLYQSFLRAPESSDVTLKLVSAYYPKTSEQISGSAYCYIEGKDEKTRKKTWAATGWP